MMRKIAVVLLTAGCISFVSSCKSGVTLKQVRAQEEEARESVQEAQEEALALARMKQQYSEDSKKARLEQLRERVRKVQDDIDKLEDVSGGNNSEVKGNVNTAITSLKNDKADLEKQIDAVEKLEKENWSSAIDTINTAVKKLEMEIEKMTANLPKAG